MRQGGVGGGGRGAIVAVEKPKKTETNDPVAEIPVDTYVGTTMLLNTAQEANNIYYLAASKSRKGTFIIR
jgi:hypothetical protein